MFKIAKLMMVVVVIGTFVVMSTGCSSSDDDSYADVAGVWEVITYDDPIETDDMTISQDGNSLSVVDPDGDVFYGSVDGASISFEYTEVEEGVTVTMLIELTADNDDVPTFMTGTVQFLVESEVIEVYDMTWTRQ
jgi:hypothetical protein